MDKPIIGEKSPKKVELVEGKYYAYCQCGRSKRNPLCDGSSHKETDINPMIFKAEKTEERYLCRCKQTSTPPFCDGTHKTL
jgi:CDGSH-type Zn-finger protein